ncbi:MAG: hypothetical protein E6J09_01155 [Chloroflexi bacterium]|nr:MAG: hypothetical protein E6J09_01155 [Chloroflexota bacterium]
MDDVIEKIAGETMRAWPDLAAGTRTGRPKAWGALAAHGVKALRDQLGRPVSDDERRRLWAALWRAAEEPPPS